MADPGNQASSSTKDIVLTFATELVTSPVNLALLGVCGFLLYKIFCGKKQDIPAIPREPELPPMKKQDMTLEQIRQYDGKGPDGRLLMAVNSKVFDVTRGKRFYGPGGPYGVFAGRDASRGLATFSLTEEVIRDNYDDLSDLSTMQMDSVREWDMQFMEKYDYVGRLLRPGEMPQDYTDTEDEHSTQEKAKDK